MKLETGKINILIDGQFGSTGKGLLASYIASENHIDISISNASSNAGHTFYYNNEKYVTKHIPVSGIMNDRNTIYLCPGAILNPKIFLEEIKKFDIDENRIFIHPRCAIITEKDIEYEKDKNSSLTKISSTQSGVGTALANKINRCGKLAGDVPELKKFIRKINLHYYLENNCTILMEVPQGFDLSISSGFSYPYCTSREITISSALSDAQVHPMFLGKTAVCIRTFPIRVGNIMDEDGNEIGYSGPFWSDSKELTWDDIGVESERTTVTGRIRRVATFSFKQYHNMLDSLRPDYILLNFSNYLSNSQLNKLINKLDKVTHLGFGPKIEDVYII